MENKSNSLSRVKSYQREKVLRFSIRKYSFGAASVAVAALMFLGARVASADSVIENNSQPTTDVVKKKEKDKPLAELQQPTDIKVEVAQNPSEKKTTTNNENVIKVVDKAKLKKVVEELKTTLSSKSDLDKSVISPIKDRVQKGQVLLDSDTATQKDVDELLSLLESDLTVLSNATKESSTVQETATENKTEIKDNKTASELSEADKTISDKKESLKLSAEELQAAVLELPEHESTKEVFEKANELLGLAQGVIQNTTISLNDVEDVTKRVKRMFNSVKIATLRLTSGKNDPRNGNKIEEGTNVRAASISPTWDSSDNLLIYQRHRASDGSRVVRNGLREYTEKKVDMFAKTTTINGERYVVYDVFFNNDGVSMAHLSRYQIYRLILPPQILDLTSEGLYKGNTLRDLKFETYTRTGNSGTLSQNPENFTRTATHNVNFLNNSTDYGSGWRRLTYFNALDIRHNRSYNQDMSETFKGNSNDPLLIHAVTRTESKFNQYSYGFGVKTEDRDSAIHMQVKAKLKAGVTDDQVREAFALAVAGTFGKTTNQAYTFVSGKDANEPKYTDYPDQPVQPTLREKQAKLYPIQGSTHTKVVGDTILNTGNPVADKYITRKGSGDFPAGMSWSWEGNNSPSTANAGKFTYTAIARYQDGSTSKDANSGSDGRVYFTVNPKKPTITTSVVNKKGLTNQTIEVNVGSGVKNGSVVKLYDGNRVIGQGTSNGTTARITVSGALPGNPLKAETTVDNGGVVVSEKSDPVTPTEAPDTQAPTLAITPANQTVVEGQTVTFTVTARDNKIVNLDTSDFITKYGSRLVNAKASATNVKNTDTEKIRTITITTTAEDVGKTNTITFNATDNANHRATPVTFTFTVTSRDKIAPTITAGNATVTSREQITPISVTAVDNTGGVGMRDNNPIEVTGLPSGLTYANNRITGTPTGAPGNSTVTIKAYDKNGNMATKTITITVRSQADAHNPTGAGLTVNQNHTITDAELKAKVSNYAPGTLSIVSRPSTATAGNAGNAVVKVTYPDGTFDNVNVPVTVTDVTGPTITANNATVTNREQITPIPVTAVDNTGGVGMRQNKPIEVTGLPAGLTYANNQITGTPTGPAGNSTVTIKAYDRNNTPTTKTITITVRSQADVHNPTGAGLTVNQNHTITDAELKAKVSNYAPGTLSIVSRPSTATAGNAGNAVVKVTYPDGTFDNVNVPVTVTDVTGPTITAESATVTKNESITPIPVTAVDNTGGVGMRDNNPIEVTNLPAGLRYANNQITGTPTAGVGYYTVTIKAYDKNNRLTTKQIRITVRSQADAHNPTGSGLTVNQNHTITDAELKAKVSNAGPGTLSIVSRPSTANAGNAGNAVVKVTYPDGTFDNVNVPVTVTDVTGPTITAESATVTKNESITPIPVTAVDNTGGVGMRDNNPIEVTNLPAGLRYANNQITGTPTAGVGYYTVTIKAYDKNNRSTTKQIRITVQDQASKYNPTGETLTVPYNHNITDDEVKAKVQNFAPGTLTVQSKPSTNTSGNVGNAVVKVTYPDGSHDTVNVPVVVGRPNKDDYTPKYNDGSGKPGESVEIPVGEANGKTIPAGTTYTSKTPGVVTVDDKGKVTVTIPADKNPGDEVTGKVLVRYPDGSEEEVPVKVTVVNRDKDDYTPKYNDGSGKPGASVEIPVGEANGKTIPAGTTYTSKTPGVVTVDDKGKVTVTIPADKNPGDEVTGKVLVRYPDGSEEEVPVKVTVVNRDKDDYTPKYNDGSGKPGESVEIPVGEANGKTIPAGTTYTSKTPGVVTVDDKGKVTVTIPADKNPGDEVTGKVLVRYPDGSEEEVPVKVTVVNRDKDDYTPKYNDGSGKPGASVDIPVSEANGKTIPSGTTYTSGTPGLITVDDKGKVTVTIPADKNPGDEVTGKVLVRYPDGSEEEVPVKVTVVNRDKDDYTPKYNDGSGKPGESVDIPVSEANGKTIPAGTTYTSKTPGVVTVDDKGKVTVTIPADKNPGDEVTGKVLVRYPDGSEEEVPVTVTVVNRDKDDYTPKYNDGSGKPGASVDIPVGEANGKTIPAGTTYTSKTPGVVTVDDKGKVTVTIPADKNPGDEVTGKVLVRYPDGSEEEVPVKVTVVNRDKDDYTPKYNDGSGKPGASVDIPVSEANGKTIPAGTTYTSKTPGVVTVDDKGKVTVTIPADKNPGDEVTGKVLVRYPDGSEEEVPVKVTVVNRDKDDYTPKYNDGSGKPGESVEIPVGEANGKTIPSGTTYTSKTPGVVTVDDKGKVTVTIPADKTPGDEVTGKVLVRYPDGSEEEVPVKVTVVNRDKDDYTPQYNDGSGKPGESVDIPVSEANGKTIPAGTTYTSKTPGVVTVDDKGKVTVTIPADKTPGDEVTGKVLVRYPDGSEEEVPVKVTVVNRDKDDYTPKYNDGSGKPGASVDIPVSEANGKTIPAGTTYTSGTPGLITVDDKGKVTVTIPADKNPGDEVTGKVLVRYPDGSEEEVPVKVTVVNRDKDDYTPKYEDGNGKPGSKVEIPLTEENGKKIPDGTTFESDQPGVIAVDKDGKVTVTIPEGAKPGDKITGKVLVRYPDGSTEEIPVTVTVGEQDKDIYTPKYEDGNGKPGSKVEIPLTEENGKKIPDGTTFESDQPGVIAVDKDGKVTVTIPEGAKPGDKITGKVLVRYPDGSTEEIPVTVTVGEQDKDIYTPKYEDGNGKPGSKVEIPLTEENGKKIPDGTTFESDQPGVITVDKDGKVTVTIPEGAKPGDKITGKVLVRYPDGSTEEIPVTVTVGEQDKDIYTPKYEDGNGKPGSKVEIPLTEENGKKIPDGTTFESDQPGVITVDKDGKVTVTIPEGAKPGDKITGKVLVRYPDGSTEEIPVTVTVGEQDKDIYTPKYEDGNGKPGSKVEIPLTEENGKKIPDGTTFESDQPGVITVDKDGKVTVTIPEGAKPGDKITGKVLVRYPDGSTEEIPVTVTVGEQDKDIYTPKYDDGNGKPGESVEIPVGEANGKTIPTGTTYTSLTPGVVTVDDKGKVTITIPADKNPGDEVTGKVLVRYPDGSEEEVPVKVTVVNRDKDDYTPKYEDGNGKPGSKVEIPLTEENGKKIPDGTTFESDQPGVIAVDKDGKVTVTIPEGAKPGDKITGKVLVRYPDGSTEEIPVTVTVGEQDKDIYTPKYEDGNGKPGSKVEIPLTEENGKKIPDGTTFESDQPGVITVDKDGKVTVTIPEGAKPGDKITGKVLVRYPDGSTEEIPVTVTVGEQDKDIYTPKYEDGNGKPGSKVEIPLTEENGKKIPDGTTFESDQPGVITVDKDGKVTVTIPEGAKPGDKITGKVLVRYPDGSTEEIPVTVTVGEQDKDIYTPKYEDGNGKPGSKVEIPLTEENGKKIPDGTTFESDQPGVITVDKDGKVTVTIPEGAKPGDKITGKVLVRYPDGSTEEIPVTVTVGEQDKDIYTPKYEDGNGKPGSKVEIPLTEENGKKIPDGTTFESDQPGVITVDKDGKVTVTIPEGAKPGDKITGKVLVRYPDGSTEEIPVTVTVGEQDKDIYTPKYDDGNGKPGESVEIPVGEANGKTIPTGTTYTSLTPGVVTVDDKGKVTITIPADKNPGDEVTGKVLVRYPDGSEEEVPVKVTVVNRDKDDYTPKYEDGNGKPGSKVEIPLTEENGKKIPDGTTFESDQPGVIAVDKDGKVTVTIPEGAKPGDKITGKVLVRYPDGSTEEIPVTVTVGEQDKDIYTPKYEDGNGKPGSKVEIPLTEENGKKIPDGTTFESDQPGVITVDKDGKVTVTIPEGAKPGDKITGKVLVRYPDGSTEEIPVTVTVGEQDKDIYTPKYEDGNGKPGSKVEIPLTEENGKKIPDGTTFESDQPGVITVDKDGKVTVTIPEGAKPGDKITGKVLVRYPDGSTEEIPVTVTVGEQDKDIYTPKYEDGNGKPGESVEIPVGEANGKTIPSGTTYTSGTPGLITVDDKGKVTVTIPADKNPGDEVTGKVLVRYPDGSEEEVPVKVTVVNRDKDIYTPKYEDGNGKPGSKVEIPLTEENGKKIPDGTTFESDQPGVITVDKDGKVTVTIPEGAKPGDKITGKVLVRYPDGSTEEIPVSVTVTTPARKTPTVELEQDPKTGDVTVTPKKPDGSTYPPGTKVEIPGKDGNSIIVTIGEDGKGKVPNSELPDGKVPGTAKITEPGQPTVEVPDVTTPGKVTPSMPTDTNPVAPVTPDTPVKPDTNGGSGQDTPAPAPATPTPNADQVDTKTTVDNGAKSNDSQNVLPNTGTESNAALASLGLLGLLSGFGLVARKKKED